MTDSRRTKPQPITIARIERAMDILAHWMVKLGDDGVKCLPIYERLEMELEQLSSTDSKMAEVFARAGRLKDQNPKPQRQIFMTSSQRNNETEHHIQVRANFD